MSAIVCVGQMCCTNTIDASWKRTDSHGIVDRDLALGQPMSDYCQVSILNSFEQLNSARLHGPVAFDPLEHWGPFVRMRRELGRSDHGHHDLATAIMIWWSIGSHHVAEWFLHCQSLICVL